MSEHRHPDAVVTVYTARVCGQCQATKVWLRSNEIAYDEVDLEAHPDELEKLRAEFSAEEEVSLPIVKTSHGDVWSGFRIDKLKVLVGTTAH